MIQDIALQVAITVILGGVILIILFLWAILYQLVSLRELGEHTVGAEVYELRKRKRRARREKEKAFRKAEKENYAAAREARIVKRN